MTIHAVYDEKPFIPVMGFQSTIEQQDGTYEYRSRGGQLNTHSCTRNYLLTLDSGNQLLVGVYGANPKSNTTLLVAHYSEDAVQSIIGVARLENLVVVSRNDLRVLPDCMDAVYRLVAEQIAISE